MTELILIGSGSGIPYKSYGPPCFAVKEGNNTFIVDIGYDSLQKILEYIDVNTVEDIFITHTHPDHFWGLLPYCFYLKCLTNVDRKSFINIYGHEKIEIFLSFIKNYYNWFDKKPYVNFINVYKSGFKGKIKDISYYAMKARHSEDSFAYKFIIRDKIIVFTGDTEYSKELVNFSKNAYILVCECSYIEGSEGHMDIDSFKRFFLESNSEKAVLVHNYRESGYELALLKLKEELKDDLIIGKDGLVLNF